jgi:alkylhydroperoxidase/carboxymuconolactone decarboxylase family protein YurZ
MPKKQKTKKARAIDPKLAKRYREHAAERGYHFSTFEWLAARDPEFEKVRLPLVEETYLRKNPALPVKYKELIAATILAFRGYPSVGKHFKRALEAGATVQEVIEALEIACIPGGMPTLHLGIDHLIELEREHPGLFKDT